MSAPARYNVRPVEVATRSVATAFVTDVSSNLPVAESNQCRALPESVTTNRLLPDIPIAVTPAGICTEYNCLLSAT